MKITDLTVAVGSRSAHTGNSEGEELEIILSTTGRNVSVTILEDGVGRTTAYKISHEAAVNLRDALNEMIRVTGGNYKGGGSG